VAALRQIGILPDILLCRCERPLESDLKRKMGLFCNVDPLSVFTAQDAPSIYLVPQYLHDEGLDAKVTEKLNIWAREPDLSAWTALSQRALHPSHEVEIAIVGKYVELTDSYKSLNEALRHGGFANDARVNLRFIDSEALEREVDLSAV
jgi:CTP synthase